MKRDISKLTENEFDVVVIGAGMFGVCAAWEAAHRGLSVALIEKGDFCGATSANHFKMVHGGIRYIQHGDIYRIRESSTERSAFLRVAPHLVQPLPIMIPTYGHGMKGKEILGTGMWLYDLFTADRNLGIEDPKRKIPVSKFISRQDALDKFPGLNKDGLTGAAIFNDAQMYNPPRLALSYLRSAVEHGAVAANYCEATGFTKKGNKVTGVIAKDILNNENFEIRGKFVLNTVGPWTNELLEKSLGFKVEPDPAFSRDAAFVVKRVPQNNIALATTLKTKDVDSLIDRGGRHVFMVPWIDRNVTLIGVWHIVWGESKDKIYLKEEELKNFIGEVNEAYPEINLTMNDVSMINIGLTLFGERTPGSTKMSFGKRSLMVDHLKQNSIDGMISIVGVRATIARGIAEKAIDKISKRINKNIFESKSKVLPVYGGKIGIFDDYLKQETSRTNLDPKIMKSLIHNYGSEYSKVLGFAGEDKNLLSPISNTDTLKAEIIHAVKDEMAQNIFDVLLRRTDIGTAGNPGVKAISESAEILQKELKWSDERKTQEIENAKTYFEMNGAVKDYHSEQSLNEVI